jgi:hypothetical protein
MKITMMGQTYVLRTEYIKPNNVYTLFIRLLYLKGIVVCLESNNCVLDYFSFYIHV